MYTINPSYASTEVRTREKYCEVKEWEVYMEAVKWIRKSCRAREGIEEFMFHLYHIYELKRPGEDVSSTLVSADGGDAKATTRLV